MILYSGDLAARTKPQSNRSLHILLLWVTALLITPLYTLPTSFIYAAYHPNDNDEYPPVYGSIAVLAMCGHSHGCHFVLLCLLEAQTLQSGSIKTGVVGHCLGSGMHGSHVRVRSC